MKNKILVLLLSVLFILGLIFANIFLNKITYDIISNDNDSNTSNISGDLDNSEYSDNTANVGENNVIKEEINMNILELTSENFEEEVLKSEKTVLIDFYADWCGPCKMMAPVVEKIASEQSDLKVVKINIDNEESLAIKYRIISIPTFVVIKNGEEVNRIVGMVDKSELEEAIK